MDTRFGDRKLRGRGTAVVEHTEPDYLDKNIILKLRRSVDILYSGFRHTIKYKYL